MRKLNLRQLILLLSVSTALLLLANTFYTSHKTQRALLITQTLEASSAYAAKTADSVNGFLLAAQQQLAFAAQDVLAANNSLEQLEHIAERLKQQTNSFNSVWIVNAEGTVNAVTLKTKGLLGEHLHSAGAEQALQERRPLISKPYIASTGRFLIFISHPVIDQQGTYLGFVGGSIYLHEESILYSLLGQHYHADESYIYVVDQDSRLIYHQEPKRVGEVVRGNPVIEQVIAQKAGSQQLINSKGVEMLAGYAPVLSSGWGVVVQRSLKATLAGMDEQMLAVAKYSFPFFILTMLAVWVVSRWISQPLWTLARSAESLDKPDMNSQIASISAWYFEASQLKRAMLRGLAGLNRKIGKLNLESITDPLTGLMNRRGMQIALDEWEQTQQPFSVVMGDIDHFKRINDKFGHDAGDEVLKFFAAHLQDLSRPDDLVCRVGGEEFLMLLPNTNQHAAHKVAERLRQRIEQDICSHIGVPITLSFGVASWPCAHASIADVMKNADLALYAAKAAGRNQVHSSQTICP
ncbi:MAG: sensor domain-containing diguanylate cyclase [Pseudomonas sp.]|jgi:diguanylate cyclase (GGDEF)-like protein|nr:sensor domain-containing diguanylate cyclase [Pseudomonas sp.]MDD2222672.1 sensor domain-containing diguanylate cyclase [Pseudomonas sp.]MDY0413751.1 sensor domain-containing diguanylate cyclase [Pseudomonas sp.]NLO53594.1 GGDEF domain-containing protein [Gammaproteobacteria bacterium]